MADENRETQIDNKTHVLLNLIQIRWRHLQNQIHLLQRVDLTKLVDPNAEITKRFDLAADKNCVQTQRSSFTCDNKLSQGKTYLAIFVSVYADTQAL